MTLLCFLSFLQLRFVARSWCCHWFFFVFASSRFRFLLAPSFNSFFRREVLRFCVQQVTHIFSLYLIKYSKHGIFLHFYFRCTSHIPIRLPRWLSATTRRSINFTCCVYLRSWNWRKFSGDVKRSKPAERGSVHFPSSDEISVFDVKNAQVH